MGFEKWFRTGDEFRMYPKDSEPDDAPLIQCECGSTDLARLFSIVGVRIVRGQVITVERGARYACQRCPKIFSVGPSGRFNQDPRSYPPSQAVAPSPRNGTPEPEPPPGEPRRPLLIPRERPE